MAVIVYENYVILLLALKSHIFTMFGPLFDSLSLIQANTGRKFDFWSNFPINTINKVNWILLYIETI